MVSKLKKHLPKIGLIVALFFLFLGIKKYVRLSSELNDLRANQEQLIKKDEPEVVSYEFSDSQMKQYIDERFSELSDQIDSSGIKEKHIERIVVQKIQYRDTAKAITTIQPMVEAIKKNVELVVPFKDSTACTFFGGNLKFNGDSLLMEVNIREYRGTINSVGHLYRPKKKILFFKTRWFSKLQAKVTTFSDCGTSKTVILNNRKLRKKRGKK